MYVVGHMKLDAHSQSNTYRQKLRDPRWQKMRLRVFERDDWMCQRCFCDDESLQVHHTFYQYGLDPWECPIDSLVTVCEHCHEVETEFQRVAKNRPMTRNLAI
jgi:5-methylcytosine-specific restriction endonuclease McrA